MIPFLSQLDVSPSSLLVVKLPLAMVETRDDARHLPALHQLEQHVGEVEEAGLEEEDEGDPLVVGLVLHLVPLPVVLPHTGVDHITTCRRSQSASALLSQFNYRDSELSQHNNQLTLALKLII